MTISNQPVHQGSNSRMEEGGHLDGVPDDQFGTFSRNPLFSYEGRSRLLLGGSRLLLGGSKLLLGGSSLEEVNFSLEEADFSLEEVNIRNPIKMTPVLHLGVQFLMETLVGVSHLGESRTS